MRRRGFTLIELLMVIAIVSLLISILLPALSQSRRMGRRSVTLSNLRDVGVGFMAYAQDSDDHFPVLTDPEEKAFFGVSVLARSHQLPEKSLLNPNTLDTGATQFTEDGRPILAELGGVPVDALTDVQPGNVEQIRWHISFAYDPDPKKSQTNRPMKLNTSLPQVFFGDRADYATGRTFSANWGKDGMCLLWTDTHAEFSKHRFIEEQGDPNIYHHNELDGEGGDEQNGGVKVTEGTRDTHLRVFTEEEDDALLQN